MPLQCTCIGKNVSLSFLVFCIEQIFCIEQKTYLFLKVCANILTNRLIFLKNERFIEKNDRLFFINIPESMKSMLLYQGS